MQINDGAGFGYSAAVLSNHRLLVDSDSREAITTASLNGQAFRFVTGLITLTSASASAVMYLKNNEVDNLVLSEIVVRMNQSTGGASGVGLWEVLRNPTAGTIISGAVVLASRLNTNFGSTATISVDGFKGTEGNTFTDGAIYDSINGLAVPQRAFLIETAGIVVPRGASIGIRYTPPTGNTSIIISVEVGAYLSILPVLI